MSGAAALTLALVGSFVLAQPAQASHTFQLPFPCGQTWHGNSSNSSAHVSYEIDFNRGGSAYSDLGDTVVAAEDGKVVTASYQTSNGYGNLVVIDHANGYYTYYAHLKTISVDKNNLVRRGQPIGSVGNTSAKASITPHLHYEVRRWGRSQSDIVKARFDGSTFAYPDANVTSQNCINPYDPVAVCGSSYYVIDTVRLGTSDHTDATTNLLWSNSTGKNCVVTLKMLDVGTPTWTKAKLRTQSSSWSTDAGNFSYYAGPVKRTAPSCVKWGGYAAGHSYTSPWEHCSS